MLFGFFGRVAPTPALKQFLDVSSERTKMIADRVAKATLQNTDGFSLPEAGVKPGSKLEGPVDIESEMVSLADEQLHFEATAKLLQSTYDQIRASLRNS